MCIDDCKKFLKTHLEMMRDTKKLLKTYYKAKDSYMSQNQNFVFESLIKFEQNHLDPTTENISVQ